MRGVATSLMGHEPTLHSHQSSCRHARRVRRIVCNSLLIFGAAQCVLDRSTTRCDDDPAAQAALSQCIGLLPICRSDILHLGPREISLVLSTVCSHFDDRQSDMVASRSRVVCPVSLAETSLAFASMISSFEAEAISKRINKSSS